MLRAQGGSRCSESSISRPSSSCGFRYEKGGVGEGIDEGGLWRLPLFAGRPFADRMCSFWEAVGRTLIVE